METEDDRSRSVSISLVTGANQGLGFALADGLAARQSPGDVVYLTGRDRGRVEQAAARIAPGPGEVRTALLDVRDGAAAAALADAIGAEHGGVDVVFSNHYARVMPEDDPAEVVAGFVDTNNLGTTRVLRAFAPILRAGGRLFVVASSLGTLKELPPALHGLFDSDQPSLDQVDATMIAWRDAVIDGSAAAKGWPGFINIPSKIGQVAAVRALTRRRLAADAASETLIAAVCPGMVDTGASRPWFDMSNAQSPAAAAEALLDLAQSRGHRPDLYGELVRFGRVLPWRPVEDG